MDKYTETKEILSNMAAVKMDMNSHKGNIEDVQVDRLVKMLSGEVDELKEAIDSNDLMKVIEEAADVMNFLVATTHQQILKYRNRK